MKKLFLILFVPLLLCACSVLSSALTDKDIAQYIQAYDNIAASAPELAKLKSENNAASLLTCGPCRARLEQAVQQAGYADMKTFVAMEVRLHITLRAWVYAAITKMGGEVGKEVAAADFCGIKENIAQSKNPEEMKLQCARLESYSSYLDKAGSITVKLAEKLLKDGDIEVVGRHMDAISAAHSNPKLPEEFGNSPSGKSEGGSSRGGYDD